MPTTHQQGRRAVALALDDLTGPFITIGPGVGGSTATTIAALYLRSSDANVAESRYNGAYAYHIPTSGVPQVRVVARDTYDAALGTIDVSTTLGTQIPATGDAVELTRLFPPVPPPLTSETSYRDILNAALRKLLIPDRITVAITTAQSFTLPTWLDREERIQKTGFTLPNGEDGIALAVYEPSLVSGGTPVLAAWRRPRLVLDGQGMALTLDVPFLDAGGSLSLDVLRPADTLMLTSTTSGAYVDWSGGFVNEGDTARVEVAELREVALAEAMEVLAHRGNDNRWNKRWRDQLQIARAQPHYDRTLESSAASAVPEREAA